MDYQGALYSLLRSVGFKAVNLSQRLLQEKGASEIDTYAVYRYGFPLAVVWSLIFVRKQDLIFIYHSPKLMIIFGSLVLLWNLQALIISFIINSTSSMVLFTTLFNMITLPLYLGFGIFFNGDAPNFLIILSILTLLAAFLINPAHHKSNLRPRLSKPLIVIVLLILLKACCDSVLDGISREALQEVTPVVFLGVFATLTLGLCAIISRFYIKPRFDETEVIKDKRGGALLIPIVWFLASIPEAYALAALPIYTVLAIGAVTFGMDTVSDMMHKRIHLNLRTAGFITLVLAGTGLAVLSV